MNCPKCRKNIAQENIRVETAAHDDELVEITAFCEDCEREFYTFVSLDDFAE